jgi:exodeoxyribonuclease V alpha subunit
VLRLLALLVEDRQATGAPPLRATLLAPTGKAAARLAESIRERVSSLPCSDSVRHAIPIATSTIHRALGWRKDHPTRFRHDERHPLQTDVVVVDEASMVDLALLSKLLAATPKHARMVLLGDEDQLASVEVGAILGDICNAPARSQNSNAPIAQCIFRLEKSHRFGAESGIGALAHAIQAEDADAALSILNDPARSDVRLVSGGPGLGLDRSLRDEVLTHYRAYLEAESPNERAVAFGRFRVLCAHAAGPRGVSAVNQEVERTLARAGLLSPKDAWYPGRPIMVRENDYSLDLYNGDIGFIMKAENGDLRAHFVSGDGSVRSLSPGRLPQHDTVFGMTIHKSQGSEMDHVSVVLPDQVSLVISRELLYTAVTRARHHVTVYARPEVLRAAVERRIQRASGLTDRLWRSGAQS